MELKEICSPIRLGYRWIVVKICTWLPPGRLKNSLYRHMGADVSSGAWISPGVIIDPVFPEGVHISDDAFIGWDTKIFTHMVTPDRNLIKEPVIIDGFVGGDCTIEPGCKIFGTLGAHSYLRRGKVVGMDEYWYGIPAKEAEK